MATAHREFAFAIVLLALGGTLWSGYVAYRKASITRLRGGSGLMVAVLGAQAVFGIVLALMGSRPHDALHFVFGPAAILALPAALALGRGRSQQRAAVIFTVAWLVTLALSLRAVATGGGLS